MKNIFCIKIQVSTHDTKNPKSGKWKEGYEEVKRGKWKVESEKWEGRIGKWELNRRMWEVDIWKLKVEKKSGKS